MKKLKLDLDGLSVESFQPLTDPPSPQGTVRANSCRWPGEPDYTQYWSTCDDTQDGGPSCHVQCPSLNGCRSEWIDCDEVDTVGQPGC